MSDQNGKHIKASMKIIWRKDGSSIICIGGVTQGPHFQADFPFYADDETDVANAGRIAAAWNACDGIPTEALEDGVVADVLESLRRCVDDLERALRDGYEGVWSEDDFAEHLAPYRAAIAKATGGAA